jgi:hypothetical protein
MSSWKRRPDLYPVATPHRQHRKHRHLVTHQASQSGDQAVFQQHTPHATAFAIQRSQINSSTRCHTCGGLGHGSSIDGKSCLTRELGFSIPKPTLLQIKYPIYPTGEPTPRQVKEALMADHTLDKLNSLPESAWQYFASLVAEGEAEFGAAQAVGYRSDGGRGRGKGKQPFVRRRFPGKGKGKPAPTNQQVDLAKSCEYYEAQPSNFYDNCADEPEHHGEVFSIEYDSIVVSNNAVPTGQRSPIPNNVACASGPFL